MHYAFPCQNPEVRDALFFSEEAEDQRQAAALCFDCPMMLECQQSGQSEEHGVWGGITEFDRPEAKRLAEQRRLDERNDSIREMAAQGVKVADMADHFGLSTRTVKRIKNAA